MNSREVHTVARVGGRDAGMDGRRVEQDCLSGVVLGLEGLYWPDCSVFVSAKN